MNKIFPFLLFAFTLSLGAGALFFAVPRDYAERGSDKMAISPGPVVSPSRQDPALLPIVSGSPSDLVKTPLPLVFSPSPPDADFSPQPLAIKKQEVFVFDDFLCPHCQQNFLENLLPFIRSAETTAVFTFYTLPTNGEASEALGNAAFCAEQAGKGIEFRETLYSAERKVPAEARIIAGKLGIDLEEFDLCLNSSDAASHLAEGVAMATNAGISAVPTVIIGSERASGLTPQENLSHLLRKAIAQKQQ